MIICFIELGCGQRHRSEVAKLLGSFATSDLYLCQQPSSMKHMIMVSGPGIDSEVHCVRGNYVYTSSMLSHLYKQCCFITSNSCSFTCLRHWCKQYLVGLHVSKPAKVQLLGVKSPALSTLISYKSTAPPAISVP